MLNLYNGGTQLGIQHQHQQTQIQPPQLPQPSSQLSQGIMSMSMSSQQPPQGQNIPSNIQNPHPLPHQFPHGHIQSQRGVMITPQQPRGFPSGGPAVGAGPGPGSELMPNPNSNPNPNAATAGMYPHGPPLQQGARRMPNAPAPNAQPPTSMMGGGTMMGLQIPMQHQTHPHISQHGMPPNQQLPPHLNLQQQQQQQPQSQQPPHLGRSPHLTQQNMSVNSMNINNPLQHAPQGQAQPSNTGLPPSIAGQIRQGGPNARMLANHGPPPGGGGNGQSGSGGAGGEMTMGGMSMSAINMSGFGISNGMGRGQHPHLGPQTVNGMPMPTVMGRGGGAGGSSTASGMPMMNIGMNIPQPPGSGQSHHSSGIGSGIPHRTQSQSQPQQLQQSQPSSQNQPFNLGGAQPRPPSSQQQRANVNSNAGAMQTSGQQPPLTFNPSHVQPPSGHGSIHTPVPPNATGNNAPSPNRPPIGSSNAMNALRAQNNQQQQAGQGIPGMQQGPGQRLSAGPSAALLTEFQITQRHQQQEQRQQLIMGMGGPGMNDFGGGGGGGSGPPGRVGIQQHPHPSGGGFFIPDPHANTSSFPSGTGVPGVGPNTTALGAHAQISKANQAGGTPNPSSSFTAISHPQGLQQAQHPRSNPVGHGPGMMHMGAGTGQQQQQQQDQSHLPHPHPHPHPSTPHLGAAGPNMQRGGGGGAHPSLQTQSHGQLLHGHPHSQLSGTAVPPGSTHSVNPNAPTSTTPVSGIGTGPSSVMIPHPNGGPSPSNVTTSGSAGRNPPGRVVGMGGGGDMNISMGANMTMPMNTGMRPMFLSGGPGAGPGLDTQVRGQTPNANLPSPVAPLLNQSPRENQQIPGSSSGQGSVHSRTTPRPPSRHQLPNSSPSAIPHHITGMGMGRGPPGSQPSNPGSGPHPPGNAPASASTSPQARRTSLPPGFMSEGAAIGPGALATGPGGMPPHPPGGAMRPPFPNIVGNGQGLIRVLAFSGAINAENDERLTRSYWSRIVNEYFAPQSLWKLTLWRDERREAKLFEIGPEIIAMFLAVSSQAGVKSMNFVLDNVQERPIHLGISIVECSEARWIWRFKTGYTVVLKGVFSAQVTAYYNPTSTSGGTAGSNAMNAPPGATVASTGANAMYGPTPSTPGTPHSPHILPVPNYQPILNQPPVSQSNQAQPSYTLKFDSMVFDSFFHDKLLDLDCILGMRIPYASSSLALTAGNAGMGGLSDSPRTQGHKTTPATTTQGSPDIAPASTSSSSSNSGVVGPNNSGSIGNGSAVGINVKVEEFQGQGHASLQSGSSSLSQGGQGSQQYAPGPMTHSPANNIGGGNSVFGVLDERVVIEQAVVPTDPINAFGIPQASMRCLELAENVGQMAEIFRLSQERQLGPDEALQALADRIKGQYTIGSDSMLGNSMNVMGGNMGPMGMASAGANGGGLVWLPGSSSLGPGGQGQPPQPYGYSHGLYGFPPSQVVGPPPAVAHGPINPVVQGQIQSQAQAQQIPQQSQFQSQSQAHTPQSAQHTPQLTQLTKPLGQIASQSQNPTPAMTRSPRTQPPSTPSKGGGGNANAKMTGAASATAGSAGEVVTGSGLVSTAMKRKAPDANNLSIGQNESSQPPAKRVTRRKSKAG